MLIDERYYVETPEVVAIAYDVGGLGSRCLAATVDTLLIAVLQVALGAAVYGAAALAGALDDRLTNVVLALWAILGFALLWGYYLIFELIWSGQTPGKRLTGLRVIREGGRPIDFSASAVRNLVRVVDFLPFAYGLGVLSMFVDGRARRLGDFAAGTLVVREGVALTLEAVARGVAPAPAGPRAPDAPPTPLLANLHLLGADARALAEAFLRRREALAPARRAQLAADVAALLRARLALPEGGNPERLIEHVVREHRVLEALEEGESVERSSG